MPVYNIMMTSQTISHSPSLSDQSRNATSQSTDQGNNRFLEVPAPRPSEATPIRVLDLNSFTMFRIIGTGSYSTVRIVQDKATGNAFALKEMRKATVVARKNVKHVMDEKSVISKIRHPFVVNYCGSFQDAKNLYLLMDYVPGGELYTFLAKRGTLMTPEARFYAAEVAQLLSYLHSEGVVYRDLKPENILISATGHIKLTDFGFAKMMKRGERTYSLCGTPQYLAPEVVKRTGHAFEYDWWTLGILLYEMLTGTTPFEAETPYELYSNIVTKSFEMPKDLDNETISLIAGLLAKDPLERLSGSDVLHHPYFSGIIWDELLSMTPPHVPFVKNQFDDRHFDHYEATEELIGSSEFDHSVFEGF